MTPPESPSVRSDNDRFHLFGGSPVRHQEVDHPLGLDEQVTSQEEDPEDHGEGQHAHDGDLHHPHDEEAPLVRRGGHQAVVRHHRGKVAAEEVLSLVEQPAQVSLVESGRIHRSFRS